MDFGDRAVVAGCHHSLELDLPVEILRPRTHELEKAFTTAINPPEAWTVGWHDPLRIRSVESFVERRGGIPCSQSLEEDLEGPSRELLIRP
jgi:hypothetical protein